MNVQPVPYSRTLSHRNGKVKTSASVAAKLLLVCFVLLVPLVFPPAHESLARGREPIGELITSGEGIVRVNGARALWGTGVFNDSEIETSTSAAFVRLTSKAGVLSISPNSRVKISRTESKTVVRVFRGEVTVRSAAESQVETSDRTVSSAGDDIYIVSVSDKETKVLALKKPLHVLMGAAATVVAPQLAASAVAKAFQPERERPAPARVGQTTERPNLLIECRAEKLFSRGLRVVGKVTNDLTPVGGAPVVVRVMFRNRAPAVEVINIVTGTSGAFLGAYQTIFAARNADLTAGGVVEVAAQVERDLVSNRCAF